MSLLTDICNTNRLELARAAERERVKKETYLSQYLVAKRRVDEIKDLLGPNVQEDLFNNILVRVEWYLDGDEIVCNITYRGISSIMKICPKVSDQIEMRPFVEIVYSDRNGRASNSLTCISSSLRYTMEWVQSHIKNTIILLNEETDALEKRNASKNN